MRIPGSSMGYAPIVILPIAFVVSGYFVLESRNQEFKRLTERQDLGKKVLEKAAEDQEFSHEEKRGLVRELGCNPIFDQEFPIEFNFGHPKDPYQSFLIKNGSYSCEVTEEKLRKYLSKR